MPKPKPDQIVRHEIVLGKSERELLRNVQEAYVFNRISSPIVAGLSDVSFVATVSVLLGFGLDRLISETGIDPNWKEIVKDLTPDQIEDWLETQNLVGGVVGGIIGAFFGGPIGAAVGVGVGSATVEGAEYVDEELGVRRRVGQLIGWFKDLEAPSWLPPSISGD